MRTGLDRLHHTRWVYVHFNLHRLMLQMFGEVYCSHSWKGFQLESYGTYMYPSAFTIKPVLSSFPSYASSLIIKLRKLHAYKENVL